jgi:hypothetical protein
MRTFWILGITFAILTIFTSCDEQVTTTVSLENEFSSVGNGKMLTTMENTDQMLRLKGELDLLYGHFQVYLSNPNGDTILDRNYNAVTNIKIDTLFQPIVGDWTFSYQILKEEDIAPGGSFKFSLIY